MSQAENVYITGISALSAAGHDIDAHWKSIQAGVSKIGKSQAHDLSSWDSQWAGEITDFDWNRALPDRKLMKAISKQDVMGLYAAIGAAEQSGLREFLANGMGGDISVCDRTGVFVGSPGNKYFQQYDFLPLVSDAKEDMQYFAKHLFEQVHPMWLLRILPNNVLAYTGIQLGCKGINHNFTNHVVGGMQALIEAYWAIRTGQADRVLVVAYDIATEPQSRFYYEQLGVLTASQLAPFDKRHDGTVLAEGAAAIVLESAASVEQRQVKPIAEMLGGMAMTEGSGLFSLNDDGKPLAAVMQKALAHARMHAQDMNMLVAHGNGNPKSDDSEAQAIEAVFGSKGVPVTAFKSLMGHSLCASGLLDVTLAIRSLQEKQIPSIIHCEQPAASCAQLDLVTAARSLQGQLPTAMILNRGFASMNAAVVIRAYE